MVRSVGAVGTFVLGLHKKREKVPHPGLQHVDRVSLVSCVESVFSSKGAAG